MAKNKKSNSLSDLGGMVYSTNPDFSFDDAQEQYEELANDQQTLYVSADKKQRKGKVVTLIEGFEGSDEVLIELGKKLKSKCGAGGSVKDGEIIVQGNFVDKVMDILKADGFKVKRKGG
ncbi:MAG: translation initiation factor [Flavobacteriales bacterium]|nr:translation initiation factor [Flavobacteriales bacterium]